MLTLRKVGAAAGVASPLLAVICISLAILSYPAFSWTENALSDLGVVEGTTSIIFTFGLVVTGFLGIVFALLGLFRYFGASVAGRVGSAFFAAACGALVCIGVFNENFSPTHYIVSVAFFTLAPIALFILTGTFYRVHQRGLAALSVVVGLTGAVPWILLFCVHYVQNVAIPETISAMALSAWIIAVSVKMLQKDT